MHSSGSGPAVAPEPAGIIDNPGTPVASGMSTAAGPSALDEDRADVAAVSLVGGQQGSAEAEGSAKEVAGQTATAPPAQSLDQAKVPREIRLAFAGAWPWSVNVIGMTCTVRHLQYTVFLLVCLQNTMGHILVLE